MSTPPLIQRILRAQSSNGLTSSADLYAADRPPLHPRATAATTIMTIVSIIVGDGDVFTHVTAFR